MNPRLPYTPIRTCCVCDAQAVMYHGRMKAKPGTPRILAITPIMYRRGTGKGQIRNSPKVQVCEECAGKALTSGRLNWLSRNKESDALWANLRESLLDCLQGMQEDDSE